MASLEERKARFNTHMEAAKKFESDDEHLKAVNAYKKALPLSLHKKDTVYIEKKIKDLQDKVKYLADFSGEDPRDKNPNMPIYIVGGVLLLVLLIGGYFLFMT